MDTGDCPGRGKVLLSRLSDSFGVDGRVKLQSVGTFGCLVTSTPANQIVSTVKYKDGMEWNGTEYEN